MGQLNPNGAVFLSAGVPDPGAAHFMGEGDSAAISAAVSSLLYVTLGRRRLVWGGHPAITPMIWSFAEAMDIDYGAWVTLYQSKLFEDEFPEETAKFRNVVFTDIVGDRNVRESLAHMRERMLNETEFSAAVFVGGMEGILEEYQLFRVKAPHAAILPLSSTGGAALHLSREVKVPAILDGNLDYVDALHGALEVDPNERRYRNPANQPADVAERIVVPGA